MSNQTSYEKQITALVHVIFALGLCTVPIKIVHAANGNKPTPRTQEIIKFWTPERRAQAIPRDLVIDERGLGYLRKPGGSLAPYGHDIPAQNASSRDITAFAKPGGGSTDTGPTVFSAMDPASGATIGASHTFKATVTDPDGIGSVKFNLWKAGGITQSFTPALGQNNVWSISLQGFTDGDWSWNAVAKDNGAKGGNTATSQTVNFKVNTSSSGGGPGGTGAISNEEWPNTGAAVQTASGRLYFEMPSNAMKKRWNGYVCSGTVATDGTGERSIIITAAHCVYDDVNKAFARNVLFIPNQAGTSASGTDLNCTNDPMGCWAPSGGLVDVNWTTRTFSDNVAWDYAYYVVNDTGAHTSSSTGLSGPYNDGVLDVQAGNLGIDFVAPYHNTSNDADVTTAIGYSYSDDPKLMYCEDHMATTGSVNWWLPGCGLSGGSSGGPWNQLDSGAGPIISVNSWGYTDQPGMAGPKLSGTSAACVFERAKSSNLASFESAADGNAGSAVSCP
jgi:hypothetical protein